MVTEKIAVYPASRLYYEKVTHSIKSLMVNSDVDKIFLTIEDDVYPDYLPECVQTINANAFKQYFNGSPNIDRTPYVYLCLARIIYAGVFREYGRVLSLDADTIICNDIGAEPWEMDLEGCHFAGTPEPRISGERGKPYANAGVMILDVDRIHKDGLDIKMLKAINSEPFLWLEQDCINKYCKLKVLGAEWNSCQFTARVENPKIRHYAFEQGWDTTGLVSAYKIMTWEKVEEVWKNRKSRR